MGLGFGLAMNEKAMNNFSAMGEEEKHQVIEAARNVRSKRGDAESGERYRKSGCDGLNGIADTIQKKRRNCRFDSPCVFFKGQARFLPHWIPGLWKRWCCSPSVRLRRTWSCR